MWSNRAACFLRLEKWDKALQDAQIARTLDPKYVKVRPRCAGPAWRARSLRRRAAGSLSVAGGRAYAAVMVAHGPSAMGGHVVVLLLLSWACLFPGSQPACPSAPCLRGAQGSGWRRAAASEQAAAFGLSSPAGLVP